MLGKGETIVDRRTVLAAGAALVASRAGITLAQVDAESEATKASNQNDVNLGYPLVEGNVYTVPLDNGIVDRRSGLHIEALPPTLDSNGDPVAHALVNAQNNTATRKAQICLGVKVGTDRYRAQGCHEYVWNNSGTNGATTKDGDAYQSCSPGGSTTVVTIISGKRSGDQPRTDRSQETTLATTCP